MKANICSDNKILYKDENTSIFNPLKNILLIKSFLDKESCNFIIKKSEEYGFICCSIVCLILNPIFHLLSTCDKEYCFMLSFVYQWFLI